MSDQNPDSNEFSKLRNTYKYYINMYFSLYQLKTEDEEEINSIYQQIKTELIESNKHVPRNILRDILNILPYNNRGATAYVKLAKLISDEYQITEVKYTPIVSNYLFYKAYGIKLDLQNGFTDIRYENIEILTENTIYRAIMNNDLERFIAFTERDDFDKDQKLKSSLYPASFGEYSLIELCCYHGAVDCFKFLRTKFNSEITFRCLSLSFLGRNPDIMSECLKYQTPTETCMEYAIISHNIDFVTFLKNEHNFEIDLYRCAQYNNLESFLVYFDQTNDIKNCFFYSASFDISSLCEYFISRGSDINETDKDGKTALHYAARYNSKETAEFLLSHGINVDKKNYHGDTALYSAAYYNSKETAEVLIQHGANVNEKNTNGDSVYYVASINDNKLICDLLLSNGAIVKRKPYTVITPSNQTVQAVSYTHLTLPTTERV